MLDNVVSSVEPLSSVDDSNVDDARRGHNCCNMLIELSVVGSVSMVELN